MPIPKKTDRLLKKAQYYINLSLETNRLKGWHILELSAIKTKLDKFLDNYGLKD